MTTGVVTTMSEGEVTELRIAAMSTDEIAGELRERGDRSTETERRTGRAGGPDAARR